MPELPVTPAPGEVGESSPTRPRFDEAQKLRINEIVADATKRAVAEPRAENARLKAELDTLRAAAPAPNDDAEVRTRLTVAERERDALRSANTENAVMQLLRTAVGDSFVDTDLACQLLRSQVKIIDGEPVVTGQDGNPMLNSAFEPLSLKDAASQLATDRPYSARGTVKARVGSTPASLPAFQSESVAIHKLFGPDGDVEARNKLALNSPNEYRRLRNSAKAAGLVY